MDDNRNELKGYLVEYHRRLRSVLNLNQNSKGRGVPWVQRERWAYQTVEAVAEAHKLGIPLGGPYLWDLSLDSQNNVKLHTVRKNLPGVHDFDGYIEGNLPPEHRVNKSDSLESKFTRSRVWNTRSDLFQLGGTLWQLGEYQMGGQRNVHCKGAGCRHSPLAPCRSDHANPVSLSWTNNEVPAYFRKIVQLCRSACPRKRLPAADLLLLFPDRVGEDFNEEKSDPEFTLPSTGHVVLVSCDLCFKRCKTFHFHCNVCSSGDFDICKGCIKVGMGCVDEGHVLVERLAGKDAGENVLTGRQFSFSEPKNQRPEFR